MKQFHVTSVDEDWAVPVQQQMYLSTTTVKENRALTGSDEVESRSDLMTSTCLSAAVRHNCLLRTQTTVAVYSHV